MIRILIVLAAAAPAVALEPAEVIVVVNKNMPASREIADHYCKVRGIAPSNVIVLDLPKEEDISRADYEKKLVMPLRAALKDRKDKVRCLLSIYGVPLRVGGDGPNDAECGGAAQARPANQATQ